MRLPALLREVERKGDWPYVYMVCARRGRGEGPLEAVWCPKEYSSSASLPWRGSGAQRWLSCKGRPPACRRGLQNMLCAVPRREPTGLENSPAQCAEWMAMLIFLSSCSVAALQSQSQTACTIKY